MSVHPSDPRIDRVEMVGARPSAPVDLTYTRDWNGNKVLLHPKKRPLCDPSRLKLKKPKKMSDLDKMFERRRSDDSDDSDVDESSQELVSSNMESSKAAAEYIPLDSPLKEHPLVSSNIDEDTVSAARDVEFLPSPIPKVGESPAKGNDDGCETASDAGTEIYANQAGNDEVVPETIEPDFGSQSISDSRMAMVADFEMEQKLEEAEPCRMPDFVPDPIFTGHKVTNDGIGVFTGK